MKFFNWLAFGLSLVIGSTALAQDEKGETDKKQDVAPDEQEVTPVSPFEQLKTDFEKLSSDASDAQKEIMLEYRKAKSDEEKAAVIEKFQKLREPIQAEQAGVAAKVAELLDAEQSSDASIEIVTWLLTYSGDQDARSKAVDKLVEQHLANDKILNLIPLVSRGSSNQATQTALETIADKGETDAIKGVALLSLADYLYDSKTRFTSIMEDSPDYLEAMPEEDRDYFKKLGELKDEDIEGLLNKAAENFADVEFKGSTVGALAKKQLKAIEVQKSLAVGKVAPDLEGPDIDGETFKLSDYRGKVVMLDFWGHW